MKPRIGYRNFFVENRGSITGKGTNPENLGNWLTGPDSVWQLGTSGGSSFAAVSVLPPMPANYMAVVRHNLVGATVLAQSFNDTWVTRASFVPADQDAFWMSFDPVSASAWRILVENYTPPAYVAVCAIGIALDLERGLFVGHDPITENERTVSVDNLSESGQFLGRKLIRMGAQSSIDPGNISADWARDHWRPFRKHAQKYPFFWQWNPKHHDDEVALCWQSSDPSLSNSGVGYLDQKGRIDLSMPINGIVR